MGNNSDMKVYSFVAKSTLNSFTGDAKDLFNYVESNEGFPAGIQNLVGMPTPCVRHLAVGC